MRLYWHDYEYFNYEKELAFLEIKNVLNPNTMKIKKDYVEINGVVDLNRASRLVYFSKATVGLNHIETIQHKLEKKEPTSNTQSKQSTRYSVHGIHEYKGKFNPQIVRATLNVLGIPPKQNIFDPFSGSGTTLIECFYGGYNCIGFDANPLANLITKAKIELLEVPLNEIESAGLKIIRESIRKKKYKFKILKDQNSRSIYLKKWFPSNYLYDFEIIKTTIDEIDVENKNIFYILASNLLRNYSLQEPSDLRIRRRFSPFPDKSVFDAYLDALRALKTNLSSQIKIRPKVIPKIVCYEADSRSKKQLSKNIKVEKIFDGAVTSPPYAMALPYIDIQRLSLVWLGLSNPSKIKELDQNLIGSREYIQKEREKWEDLMLENKADIPESLHSFCMKLSSSIGEKDGFRRIAVPSLLYRYLAEMKTVFGNISPYFKENAPFALIVGHNSTTLGGKHIDIDTPSMLAELATNQGWMFDKQIPLDTYYRYSIHSKNSITSENMVILRKEYE